MKTPNKDDSNPAGDLAYSPSGGLVKMIIAGIIIPIILIYFGIEDWLSETTTWYNRWNTKFDNYELKGVEAKAMGATLVVTGLFCHFRWFWGLLPIYRVFYLGTVITLVGMIIGIASTMYFVFTP